MVEFNTQFPSFKYFAGGENGKTSENAFIVDFNDLREVEPRTGVIVQSIPIIAANYTFTVRNSTLPPDNSSGLIYSSAYEITYFAPDLGASVILWLFTEDQIITDLGTNRSTEVSAGLLKFSFYVALWPFVNENNEFHLSANISTSLPDTITNCRIPNGFESGLTPLICTTNELEGSLQLLNSASTFNYVTQTPSIIHVGVNIFACPTENFDNEAYYSSHSTDNYCNINLNELGSFPLSFEYDSSSSASSSNEEQ